VIKRALVIVVVVLAASAGLVFEESRSDATPTINLTLSISPQSGGPGTSIKTSVAPSQAQSVCLNTAEATAQLQSFATQLLTNPGSLSGGVAEVLASLNGGVLHSVAPLYSVAFADIATQEPISENTPGWDPVSGQGSITAPNATQPKTYAVAAVCLGLKVPSTAEVNSALAGANPLAPDQAMERLLRVAINEDPIGTGFAVFCLSDGGACATSAVVAQPTTAG
jgi:hypothetical protein